MSAARILGDTASDIARAASLLRSGSLVALPTETVYGLAGDALNETAVREIFTVKGRPLIDPLIVHVHDWTQITTLASRIPNTAQQLANAFWPGALTLILPKAEAVPGLVTAGNPTVAVRMPAHSLTRRILREADIPVAAPSANPFGYISPTCVDHVVTSLGERIAWIVDGGPCQSGIESTIVDLTGEAPAVLRPGPITPEAIARALDLPSIEVRSSSASSDSPVAAPGMIARHYSPNTALILVPNGKYPTAAPAGNAAWVAIQRQNAALAPAGYENYWFSETADLEEMARGLFGMLRKLDTAGYDSIAIELPPAQGVGIALCDRLSRAAAKSA